MELSVIIPCLNCQDVLDRQLDALAREEAAFDWEVIVVDNGSSDSTGRLAMSYADKLASLRVIRELQRGRHYACNSGARAALAPKLSFVDGDDIIEPGYVVNMAAALDVHAFVAGRLVHYTAEGEPLTGFGQVQTDGLLPSFGFLPHAAGCNMGVRKEAFFSVDGFAADVRYGEDVDLSWRLQLNGYSIAFDPAPAVRFHQRSSLSAMFRQHRRFGAAQSRLYARFRGQGMPRRALGIAALDWWRALTAAPFLGTFAVRARFIRRLARNIGRIEGSIRERVFYP